MAATFTSLKFAILNKMTTKQGVLAELIFVKLPRLCDPNSFLKVLQLMRDFFEGELEMSRTAFQKQDPLSVGHAAFGLCRLIPFFKQAFLECGRKDAAKLETNLNDFIYYCCAKLRMKHFEQNNFHLMFEYLLEQIPLGTLTAVANLADKKVELKNQAIINAVQKLKRQLPKLTSSVEVVESTQHKAFQKNKITFHLK